MILRLLCAAVLWAITSSAMPQFDRFSTLIQLGLALAAVLLLEAGWRLLLARVARPKARRPRTWSPRRAEHPAAPNCDARPAPAEPLVGHSQWRAPRAGTYRTESDGRAS